MKKATFELFIASLLWGFAFISVVWALEAYTPLAIVTLRFLVVALLGIPAAILFKSFRKDLSVDLLRATFLPGAFLSTTLLLQTFGLKYTSATNSGFITTLYVLFTPLTESILRRKRPSKLLMTGIGIAVLGTAFICQVHKMKALNVGDVFTILCAWAAVGQFISLSHIVPKMKVSAFAFNIGQSFWISLLCGVFMLGLEPLPKLVLDPSTKAFWGLVTLSFGASLIAFFLQIRAQRVLSASTASLICLMESPFAAIFAALCLHERFSGWQIVGAILILYAAILAVKDSSATPAPSHGNA